MGNLLGAPVTDKETHEGSTIADNESLPFGVTTMQGWRVHMEDAHICEPRLYAVDVTATKNKATKQTNNVNGNTNNSSVNSSTIIQLPGHSLFAVFDGHGGTFAAAYSGRNLCRVLSHQPKFVQYAKWETERISPAGQLKMKAFETEAELQTYMRKGLELLEEALCHAFVDIDREIALALKGTKVPDADVPYNHVYERENAAAAGASSGDADMTNAHPEGGSGDYMQGVTNAPSPADSALQLLEEEGDSGTTACVVVVTPDFVVCANAGDSRAVISRSSHKAVPLSFDHKPDDEEEETRIRAAGGYVAGGRVEGDLAVSRGLGDFRFKNMDVVMAATTAFACNNNSGCNENSDMVTASQEEEDHPDDEPISIHHQQHNTNNNLLMKPGDQKVSPIPDIVVQRRDAAQDEFIFIACDGIWDVQTNYEAVQTVAATFTEGETSLGLVCEEICDLCLSMGSKDNMTVLIVKFNAQNVGDGGGVQARRQLRHAAAAAQENRHNNAQQQQQQQTN